MMDDIFSSDQKGETIALSPSTSALFRSPSRGSGDSPADAEQEVVKDDAVARQSSLVPVQSSDPFAARASSIFEASLRDAVTIHRGSSARPMSLRTKMIIKARYVNTELEKIDASGGLDAACGDVGNAIKGLAWTMICASSVFFAVLLYDITGDSFGVKAAVTQMIVMLLAPLIMYCVFYAGIMLSVALQRHCGEFSQKMGDWGHFWYGVLHDTIGVAKDYVQDTVHSLRDWLRKCRGSRKTHENTNVSRTAGAAMGSNFNGVDGAERHITML